MRAWHFLKNNGELQWPCGDVIRPEVGQTLTVDPDRLQLCVFGLHASEKILDALQHAPGEMLCRVEVGGRIVKGYDKLVASERTIIAMADATETLHLMAVWSAKRALKRIKKPDPRSVAAIEAKEKWLRGEIVDAELAAAGDAAGDAAGAAGDAAGAAAGDAAGDAAWAAERKAQNRKLTTMAKRLLNVD